jgi:hypothetical protein
MSVRNINFWLNIRPCAAMHARIKSTSITIRILRHSLLVRDPALGVLSLESGFARCIMTALLHSFRDHVVHLFDLSVLFLFMRRCSGRDLLRNNVPFGSVHDYDATPVSG